MTVKVLLRDNKVVAIVDTGSSGIVVLETYVQRLNLIPDNEVKFSITLATNSTKKNCKLFYDLKIFISNVSIFYLLFIFKKLQFDLLLDVNWIKSIKALINAVNNTLLIL